MELTGKNLIQITKPFAAKNNRLAVTIMSFDILIFLILIANCIAIDSILIKIALGILLGIVIGLLFIVGHDCCHDSFTTKRDLNTLVGVICFMPSLHNFKLWELGHNKTHHAHSNLRGKDYVYTPLSIEEYEVLNPLRKQVYKIYRSIIGHLFYYLIEIWWKKMIIPHKGIPQIQKIKSHLKYSIYLLVYILIIGAYIYFIADFFHKSFWIEILFAVILPFLIFNLLMGFVIYQHHTNLNTRWFKDEEEWQYWESQIENSPHIIFPKPLNFVLHNIMEHTAHHINMDIPFYNLQDAQRKLESEFGDKIKTVNWNLKYYWLSIRKCKLYDYENHEWRTFK